MKKFLSILMVAAMLLSLVIVATVSVSAVAGDWSVYANKETYMDGGTAHSIPGYEYTDDGFHIIPADWSTTTPWAVAQMTDPVDLREGFYMEVQVNDFTYTQDNNLAVGDKWFAFEVWQHPVNEFHPDDPTSGNNDYGIEVLLRPGFTAVGEGEDLKIEYSNVSTEWFKYVAKGQRIKIEGDKTPHIGIVDGQPTFSLEIVYDSTEEEYVVYINNVAAPEGINIAFTQYFTEIDHMAYPSFSAQNNQLDGTVEFTITKYGTSKDEADLPRGDDRADPIDITVEYDDMIDPEDIPEGEPAITLTGVPADSNVKSAPISYRSNIINVSDEGYVRVYANASNALSVSYKVDYEHSVDAKDFPIMAMITKNFCTCSDPTVCEAKENLNVLQLFGRIVQEDLSYMTVAASQSENGADYIGDDSYQMMIADWTGCEGRIHGMRIDKDNGMPSEEGRNYLEIIGIYFFRTIEEADAFYAGLLEELIDESVVDPGDDDENETVAPGDDDENETVAPGDDDENETVAPGDDDENETTPPDDDDEDEDNETEAPTSAPTTNATEAPTTAPTEEKTEEKTEKPEDETKAPANNETEAPAKEGGCGGVVGVGAIAVVALAAAGLVSFKKKED